MQRLRNDSPLIEMSVHGSIIGGNEAFACTHPFTVDLAHVPYHFGGIPTSKVRTSGGIPFATPLLSSIHVCVLDNLCALPYVANWWQGQQSSISIHHDCCSHSGRCSQRQRGNRSCIPRLGPGIVGGVLMMTCWVVGPLR